MPPHWDKIVQDVSEHLVALQQAAVGLGERPAEQRIETREVAKLCSQLARFTAGVDMLLARLGLPLPAIGAERLLNAQRTVITPDPDGSKDYICTLGFLHEVGSDAPDGPVIVFCPGCDAEVYHGRLPQDAVAISVAEQAHSRACQDWNEWRERGPTEPADRN